MRDLPKIIDAILAVVPPGHVDELRQAIDDLRCYDCYRITVADKARLLKLVEAIEPLEEDGPSARDGSTRPLCDVPILPR